MNDATHGQAPEDEEKTNALYEDIFHYLGEFGRYQKRLYFLLCLPAISCALHKLGGVFLQAKPAHRCRLPNEDSTVKYFLPSGILNMTYPWDDKTGAWSSCLILNTNFTPEYYASGVPATASVPCTSWVYDTSLYASSTVIEFNLVCEDSWIPATTDAMFMFGDLIGSVTFGYFSDRFGRRPIFFTSLIIQSIAGIGAALMPNALTFVIARFIIGLTASALYIASFILALELVGPSKRLFAAMTYAYFFTTGYVLSALFSYLLNNWRYLQVAMTVPGLFLLTYWWILPESSRWLLSKGRQTEAKQILNKVAKTNNVVIPEKVLDNLGAVTTNDDEGKGKHSALDLVRYPNLRNRSLNIFFNWFVISCTYFGLSWNSSSLGGNDYLNFLISGLVEIPAPGLLILTLDRWGRKPLFTGTMLLTASVLLLSNLIPQDLNWLRITLIMIGKLSVTASFNVVYIMSAEQFPTVLRNVGIGSSSTCARIGGIVAPYVIYSATAWKAFPEVIFGLLTLSGGLLGLLLPETLNKKLPDTVQEGENYGKDLKKCQKSNRRSRTSDTNQDLPLG